MARRTMPAIQPEPWLEQQPVGDTLAHSLDVHVGLPGLRSLPVRFASPSWLRLLPEPARGHGHPRPRQQWVLLEAGDGSERTGWTFGAASASSCITATRRQDAANEHQQNVTNLGFVAFCPKESRARCPSFP